MENEGVSILLQDAHGQKQSLKCAPRLSECSAGGRGWRGQENQEKGQKPALEPLFAAVFLRSVLLDAEFPRQEGVSPGGVQRAAGAELPARESSKRAPPPRDLMSGSDILQTTSYYLPSRENTKAAANLWAWRGEEDGEEGGGSGASSSLRGEENLRAAGTAPGPLLVPPRAGARWLHGWKVASPGMDQALEGGKMRLQEGSAFCLGFQSKKDRSGTLGKGPGAPPDETSCFILSVCPTIPASAQPRVLTPFAPLGCGASPASPRSAWKPSGGLEEQGVIFSAPSFPPLLGFFISHGSGERAAGLEQEAARGGQGLVPSSGGCGLSVPPLSASSILLAAASTKGHPGLCKFWTPLRPWGGAAVTVGATIYAGGGTAT